ncbi:MAG: efflux RND transporter periplasmic adaptor subunit [Gemmataceae bacterium]|nr:efflux RND transporter periplasmic adaptor subunit [Gemmataceae bacterium]
MTDNRANPPSERNVSTASKPRETQARHQPVRRWGKVWSAVQLIVALVVTLGVLVYLVVTPLVPPTAEERRQPPPEVVRPAGPGQIQIETGTPLEKKLQIVRVETMRINTPALFVTGIVAASLRPSSGKDGDHWQFHSPEALTAYSDWQKARADIAFAETQLVRTKELADTRVESQKKVVARLKKLVEAGVDSPKELAAEETNLLQYQIQGQKEIHEAETAVLMAKRTEALLARQLQQVGLDPEMLRSATADTDIVMAEVPEGMLSAVKVGQGCQAKFFGLPGETFTGKVSRIAPVLSKERRSLRVLFVIHDPKDQLRPGMFAEIGLGTDPRDALMVPADGVIHIGRSDYVLVSGSEPGIWRVTEVKVGEPHGSQLEILSGLRPGDWVIGKGAILLKPAMVRSLQAAANRTTNAAPGGVR